MLALKYIVNNYQEVQVSGHCEECLSRATLVIRRRAAADGDGPGLQKRVLGQVSVPIQCV